MNVRIYIRDQYIRIFKYIRHTLVRKHPKDAQETAVYPREIYFSSARTGAIAILLHTVVNSESLSRNCGLSRTQWSLDSAWTEHERCGNIFG